jgi:Ca2+-binding EF-hand superfamily protein
MLTENQKKKIIHLFRVLDTNDNGCLQIDDFVRVGEAIVHNLELDDSSRQSREIKVQSSRLFVQLLVDIETEDMQITMEDWLKFFEAQLDKGVKGMVTNYVYRTMAYIFLLFDLNHDKVISYLEYANMISIYGIPPKYCKQSFNRIDLNSDGMISEEEMLTALEDFFYSDDPDGPGSLIFGEWS